MLPGRTNEVFISLAESNFHLAGLCIKWIKSKLEITAEYFCVRLAVKQWILNCLVDSFSSTSSIPEYVNLPFRMMFIEALLSIKTSSFIMVLLNISSGNHASAFGSQLGDWHVWLLASFQKIRGDLSIA